MVASVVAVEGNEEDLWGSVLQNFRRGIGAAEKGTLIVLGDVNVGKSTLLARAKGEEVTTLKRGMGLTYDFVSVYEDGLDEPTGNLDIWILEGEILHRDLLKASLTEEALSNCMALICLDLTQPWLLDETLNKWIDFLRKILADILSERTEKKLQDQLASFLQQYTEPEEVTTQRRKKRAPTIISDEIKSDSATVKFNIGIPITVVCCKSDTEMLLEKDYDMKTHIFEHIQLHLRNICFNYGATLIYTSAKKDVNTETLMDYIEHRLFGFEFSHRADLTENESIFVPAGWDSIKRITSDSATLNVDLEEAFDAVVQKPQQIAKRTPAAVVTSEDDTAFLAKQKLFLEREQPDEEYSLPSWRTSAAAQASLSLLTPLATKQPATVPKAATTSSSTKTPDSLSHSPVLAAKSRESTATPFVTPSANDKRVLATFFDALLKSKDAKRVDPSAPLAGRGHSMGIPQARHEVEKELERLKSAMKK